MSDLHASQKASSFTESVIREMTRLAHEHGAINLGQGMPDFAAPEEVKEAARRAIAEDHNQYPITWGVPEFRQAIAASYDANYGLRVDPESEISLELLRYGDEAGNDWADIIDALTMYPDARRRVVRLLGELEAS